MKWNANIWHAGYLICVTRRGCDHRFIIFGLRRSDCKIPGHVKFRCYYFLFRIFPFYLVFSLTMQPRLPSTSMSSRFSFLSTRISNVCHRSCLCRTLPIQDYLNPRKWDLQGLRSNWASLHSSWKRKGIRSPSEVVPVSKLKKLENIRLSPHGQGKQQKERTRRKDGHR